MNDPFKNRVFLYNLQRIAPISNLSLSLSLTFVPDTFEENQMTFIHLTTNVVGKVESKIIPKERFGIVRVDCMGWTTYSVTRW